MTTARTPAWKIVTLTIVGIAVSVVVVLSLFVMIALGGLDELLRGDGPQPTDPEVVAARAEASESLGQDVGLLVVATVVPSVPSATPVGEGEISPPCDVGQHNWKIDDDYDLRCGLQSVGVVAVPSTATFRGDMVALDEALRAAGWSPSFQPIPDVLTGYWDTMGGEPRYSESGDGSYGVADLPSAGYVNEVDGSNRSLTVDWVEPGSPVADMAGYGDYFTFTEGGRDATPQQILASVPEGGYAVVLRASEEYFRG